MYFMKRFLFIISILFIAASCRFDDGSGMSQSYTNTAHFQYTDVKFSPDSTFFSTQTPEGFGFDVLNFYHQLDPGKLWVAGGFLLSCLEMPLSGNTADLNLNTYRCYLTNLKKPFSNIYTVFIQNGNDAFMPKHDIHFPFTSNGSCMPQGCFITNTVEVAEYIKANFEDGDRMTLKATGYLDGKKTGESEILLADFSAQKDSIVSRWTPFELDKLGSIEYVDFEVISTKPGTPAYFCMDELTYKADLVY